MYADFTIRVILMSRGRRPSHYVFFFNDTATTEIYTLSLHDALPICAVAPGGRCGGHAVPRLCRSRHVSLPFPSAEWVRDRKSTRLNSSHDQISYAVFCLKKKKSVPYAG